VNEKSESHENLFSQLFWPKFPKIDIFSSGLLTFVFFLRIDFLPEIDIFGTPPQNSQLPFFFGTLLSFEISFTKSDAEHVQDADHRGGGRGEGAAPCDRPCGAI
jgi:hypothetical protein